MIESPPTLYPETFEELLGRSAGELLGRSRSRDVIDAALVLLAEDDDQILTSDPDDVLPLAKLSGRYVKIIVTSCTPTPCFIGSRRTRVLLG